MAQHARWLAVVHPPKSNQKVDPIHYLLLFQRRHEQHHISSLNRNTASGGIHLSFIENRLQNKCL
jgi:hypothetical protein